MKNQIIILNTLVLASFLTSVAFAESTMPAKIGKSLQVPSGKTFNTASVLNKPKLEKPPLPVDLKLQKVDLKSTLMGGVNGGGGNSINHKMIESYRKKISEMPEYKTFVVMALNDLKGYYPLMATELMKKMNHLAWYIIPKELSELPEKITGLPFSTEQVAVQTNDEVFISQSDFEVMTPEKRRDLFFHETILSLHVDVIKAVNTNRAKSRITCAKNDPLVDCGGPVPDDLVVDPHMVRQWTNSILGKDYASDSDSFVDLWSGYIQVSLLNNEEIATGKAMARRALSEINVVCKNPDGDKTLQKIGEIDYKFQWMAGDDIYPTCGELSHDKCRSKYFRGRDSYDLAMAPLSTLRTTGMVYKQYGYILYDANRLCELVKVVAQKNSKN